MKKFLVALLCVCGFTQCNNKMYSLNDLPKQFIEIGSSGGFAGISNTYHIFPNGQRFFNSATAVETAASKAKELGKINPGEFKDLLKGLKNLDFSEINLNEPGNMNYFIRLKTKKEDKKVLWNNMDSAPKALVDFYRSTMKSLKTAEPKEVTQ